MWQTIRSIASLLLSYGLLLLANGLFGTVESCADRLRQLQTLGVDEVACMVDFGIATPQLRESMQHLDRLRKLIQ